jgi:hypothetical protein
MAEQVPDRSQGSQPVETSHMVAKCGHPDMLGYFTGTVCGKCARINYHKTMVGK